MLKDFKINPKSDVPIYKQITNVVQGEISSGELLPGTKMPTVRELSAEIGIAQGTVKRAYDELEILGVVEKAQGKGTFIKGAGAMPQLQPIESRKDRAMIAIDNMFDELESMGFSSQEINIFLELKQREREARREKIKVALVECNPEVMHNLVEQIRTPDLDIYPYLLEDIRSYPYKIGEDVDLIITTATHFDELQELIPQRDKIMRVALSLTTSSVHDMLMIPPKSKVGIASDSERFGAMILKEINKYDLKVDADDPITFDLCREPFKWVKNKDYVLLPEEYKRYVSKEMKDALEEAEKKGKVILCSYRMDKGSEIQIEERIKGLR